MKRLTFLVALMLLPALLTGCGSKSPEDILVAKVNERSITMANYEKAWAAVEARFLPADDDLVGRKKFLETMINKEIMAVKADELGYEKDSYVISGMEQFRRVGLTMGYLKIKVADNINITENDVKKCFEDFYGRSLQIKQILMDTEAEALEVVELLRGGADFETTCKQYSKGPDAESGGQASTAVWGNYQPHFQDELFSTAAGDVTDPILANYGYFIIKVLKENRRPERPYEEFKDDVRMKLKQQAQMRGAAKMAEDIRDKHNFEFYEQNLLIAFEAIPPDRPLTNPPNRAEEIYPLLRFEARDLEKPVATYDDKTITIKDFSDLYDRSSFFKRPRREFRVADIRKFLLEIVMNELIEIEVETTGVENEPKIARWLETKKEQFMVDKLYKDLVDGQTNPTRNEMVTYYEDNLEQFRRAEERRFYAVVTGDRKSALAARKHIEGGRDFEAVKREFGIPEAEFVTGLHDRFWTEGQLSEVDEHGFSLKRVGDVSDAFETAEGWAVIKMVERKPDRILPFEDAQGNIKHLLKTLANEERLTELLDKWRTECTIEVYDNNLMKATLQRPGKGGIG
jgi:peptidyl-prolyl cis-trans isomerase C